MTQPVDAVPRSEYPRPQFVRPDWVCLNGPWEFELDVYDTHDYTQEVDTFRAKMPDWAAW